MANQHRPARSTPNLGIPVTGDDDNADWVTAWGATADKIDTAIPQAIQQAVTQIQQAGNTYAVRARRSALLFGGN